MKLTSIPNYTVLDTNLNLPGGYLNLENRFDENYDYIKKILLSDQMYGKDKRASSLNKIKHIDIFNNPIKYIYSRISSIFKLFKLKKKYISYNLNFLEFVIELFKRDYQKTVLRRYGKNKSENQDLSKTLIYFAMH